mmetsp:Transcript_28598/g.84298  ORF Transcript_28598/g.84298 Transcript_28598/m.84298 type:complete len:272 (-) Transcript_28598:473-1288(-)
MLRGSAVVIGSFRAESERRAGSKRGRARRGSKNHEGEASILDLPSFLQKFAPPHSTLSPHGGEWGARLTRTASHCAADTPPPERMVTSLHDAPTLIAVCSRRITVHPAPADLAGAFGRLKARHHLSGAGRDPDGTASSAPRRRSGAVPLHRQSRDSSSASWPSTLARGRPAPAACPAAACASASANSATAASRRRLPPPPRAGRFGSPGPVAIASSPPRAPWHPPLPLRGPPAPPVGSEPLPPPPSLLPPPSPHLEQYMAKLGRPPSAGSV